MEKNDNVGKCGHAKCAGGNGCFETGKPMRQYRSAPAWQDLADMEAFFKENASKGTDEAVRLAEIKFADIDLEDIRSSAESAIPEFPEANEMTTYKDALSKAFDDYVMEFEDPFLSPDDVEMNLDRMSMELSGAQGFSIDRTTNGEDTRYAYMAVSYYSQILGYRIELGELSDKVNSKAAYLEEAAMWKSEADKVEARLAPLKV